MSPYFKRPQLHFGAVSSLEKETDIFAMNGLESETDKSAMKPLESITDKSAALNSLESDNSATNSLENKLINLPWTAFKVKLTVLMDTFCLYHYYMNISC